MKDRMMAKEKNYDKIRADYETKDTVRSRQADRRQRLSAAAKKAGYSSIDKLAAAILAGEVKVVKVTEESNPQ